MRASRGRLVLGLCEEPVDLPRKILGSLGCQRVAHSRKDVQSPAGEECGEPFHPPRHSQRSILIAPEKERPLRDGGGDDGGEACRTRQTAIRRAPN